jgi:UDP-N-acetylmuramyl pentapeptide synthase
VLIDPWTEIVAALRTPLGRSRLRRDYLRLPWLVLGRLARLHRRTLARRTRVVVVVGSYGKSTTMRATTAALGRRVHRRATSNAGSAVARALLRIRPWDRWAVLEVGIGGPGQMAPYARMVQPQVVIVTSIGSEHRRSLPTLEMTRHEKAEMVRALPPSGLAVLNGDDPNVRWMETQTRARVVYFGLGESNDVRASDVRLNWPSGTRFVLHAGSERREVKIQLFGAHMVRIALGAIAAALAEGRTLDQILPALAAVRPTPGRMEVIPLASGAVLLRDDFKSQIETFQTALDTLEQLPAARRIAVIGEVTDPVQSAGDTYRGLGERLAGCASQVIFLGHRKAWRTLRVGAQRGGMAGERVVRVDEGVHAALTALPDDLGPGDVVLVKGSYAQRLERVSLALMGRTVRCGIRMCQAHLPCAACPMLERGWGPDGQPERYVDPRRERKRAAAAAAQQGDTHRAEAGSLTR